MLWVKISLLVLCYHLILLNSTNAQVTVCGAECATKCTMGMGYTWCGIWSSTKYSKWDYCSRSGSTLNGEACVSSCGREERTSYYWCKTRDSWDYCSPSAASGHNYNCTGTSGYIWLGVICGLVLIIVCCFVLRNVFKSCCCPTQESEPVRQNNLLN